MNKSWYSRDLLSDTLSFWLSLYNFYEDGLPVDEINEHSILKWVAVISRGW